MAKGSSALVIIKEDSKMLESAPRAKEFLLKNKSKKSQVMLMLLENFLEANPRLLADDITASMICDEIKRRTVNLPTGSVLYFSSDVQPNIMQMMPMMSMMQNLSANNSVDSLKEKPVKAPKPTQVKNEAKEVVHTEPTKIPIPKALVPQSVKTDPNNKIAWDMLNEFD